MKQKPLSEKAKDYQKSNPNVEPSQAWIDGYNAALRTKSRKKELDLSFVDSAFSEAMVKWVAYKAERKQAYTQMGVESCYKKLIGLSGGNPTVAMAIVEQSISNNWQGLFELKNGTGTAITSYNSTQRIQSPGQRKESVNELSRLAEGVLRGIGGNINQ